MLVIRRQIKRIDLGQSMTSWRKTLQAHPARHPPRDDARSTIAVTRALELTIVPVRRRDERRTSIAGRGGRPQRTGTASGRFGATFDRPAAKLSECCFWKQPTFADASGTGGLAPKAVSRDGRNADSPITPSGRLIHVNVSKVHCLQAARCGRHGVTDEAANGM